MLISSWLTSVRNRLQTSTRPVRRRVLQKKAARTAENLEARTLLTSLVAVRPNVGAFLTPDEIRSVAPQELTLQFSLGEAIDAASVTNKSILVSRAGLDGIHGNGDDVPISIGYVGIGNVSNEVVLRFGENLPDDKYRITIKGTGTDILTSNNGTPFNGGADDTFRFELDLGAQVVAVDPQPVTVNANGTVTQATNQIVVYFNQDTLDQAAATNPQFYQLIATNDTVTNLDDVTSNPVSVTYSAVTNSAVLTFATSLDLLPGAATGTFRLRIGNAETRPEAPVSQTIITDPGDSYSTATSIGTISNTGNRSHLLSSAINPQFFPFQYPGAITEPGHRQIEVETHLNRGADALSGTSQIDYNFKDAYGFDPLGNALFNVITAAQKDRAREIFEFYSNLLGIDFRETDGSGLTIVTGDMRALDPTIPTGPGGVAGLAGGGMAIMDMAETWNDTAGASWFSVAMHEIGHLLGLGHNYELPALTVQGSNGAATVGNIEPDFPGDHDVVHGQHIHRPDSIDIDLYQFSIAAGQTGQFTAEVIAERLASASRLDSVIRLFRQNADGSRVMIAQNNDYFSEDSFLQLNLTEGTYFLGISSVGNEVYDPTIAGTGIGGTSQGSYQLRLDFRPAETSTIIDTTGTRFDGDADGKAGGVYNFWFRATSAANTVFVNKAAAASLAIAVSSTATTQFTVDSVAPYAVNDVVRINNEQVRITAINAANRVLTVLRAQNGSIAATHAVGSVLRKTTANGQAATPFDLISSALAVATPGQIVRVVGNGGADGNLSTIGDNLPYQIGFNALNQPLPDGTTLEVPRGVTLMVDGGAVFKLRRALIGVGSSSTSVDRSAGALQVLGTPFRQVTFTSWSDETIGTDTSPTPTTPQSGDWGGISFRNAVDRAQSRFVYQNEGIFLNYVAHADLRWGGGNVVLDSVLQTINPIFIDGAQPTVVHNLITRSSDSAISANPDSFEEMTFHAPRFQNGATPFTSDYNRVGPDFYGNTLLNNSTNGLFVRVITPAGNLTQKLTIPGRFDDTDIVHVIAQNLEIQGTPGGPVLDQTPPAINLVTLTARTGGTLPAGLYNYRIALTDENGFEGPTSNVTVSLTTATTGSIELQVLPPATGAYTGRRIYRSTAGGVGPYTLVAKLDKSATNFVDNGGSLNRTLTVVATRDRARTDARLLIDPGMIIKLEGARIETEIGAQFMAEGEIGRPVIFTSRLDDRFGAGGTFDTNNDDFAPVEAQPSPGNWGGIYVGHLGTASIDRALVTFAGGIVPVAGNFSGFNAIEVHQADVRIRNTVFERNAGGTGGTGPADRAGLFSNSSGTIFVRGSQPIILNNDFRNNIGPGININANSLNYELVVDIGRQTGLADRQLSYGDNQGPLVRDNRFGGNTINGMRVRGETLTTQGVWDDTDIVHVVLDEIYVPDFHTFGGLRLESSNTSSLVIKLDDTNAAAGFTVNGYALDIDDRIGGSLQIIGQPGKPVVFTSLKDDTIGAGFDLVGLPLRDTNSDGPSVGTVGDWRGIRIQQYAHDRNVAVHVEREQADRFSQDTNGTIGTAEQLGLLSRNEKSGDENLRLGFEVHGFIDSLDDADIYSFTGTAGTQVWIDIDRTTKSLDSVVELLDANGQIIAISDNILDAVALAPNTNVQLMPYDPFNGKDLYTLNQLDAGFRVILPGTVGTTQPYFVRVRSGNPSPQTQFAGLTTGVYQLQIRLHELDEFPGTQITYADIRFAETGVEITGQPIHSPLIGESTEINTGTGVTSVTVGNLMNSDRAALYLAGKLGTPTGGSGAGATYDVDFWDFTVRYDATQQIAGFSTVGPHVPVTIDLDFADGYSRADVTVAVYDSNNRLILIGRDSNISDDQPRPKNGADTADLSRGSAGKQDPFIGPVELIGGQTYRLAVFPNDIVPQAMNQYWQANPTSSLVRFEPVNSVRRIAEERFGSGVDVRSTALAPVTDLFNVAAGTLDPKHIVPFHLGDLTLFVSQARGITGTNRSVVSSVNPFTGANLTLLGQFSPPSGDIAMRGDGQLHTFSLGPATGAFTDGNVGNYLRIDTGTAAVTSFGDDGIATNILNAGASAAHDVGIGFNAMTYTGTNDNNLWAIGNRSQLGLKAGQTGAVAAQFTRNILYNFNTATGGQVNPGNGADRTSPGSAVSGAGTSQVDYGQVDTSFSNGGLNGDITGMVSIGNFFYVVDTAGGLYRYNRSSRTNTFIANVGGLNINFAGLSLGPAEVEGGLYANTLFGISTTGRMYAFNTSGVLQPIFNDAATSVQIAGVFNVTGLAFGTLQRNLWHTTTNRGSTSAADDGHGIDVPTFDDSVAMPVTGGTSVYFGNERTGNSSGNKNTDASNVPINSAPLRNIDFPGGAHGTIVSNEFSLEGYSANDKPVLYFNYFLETEDATYIYGTNPDTLMRDALRVFVADESGQWNLLVTNNSLQDSNRADEYDLGPDGNFTLAPVTQTFVDVVEAFDNTNGWRQARVDLSNFAGRAGLKLRFDFSTAGSMNVGNVQTTGSELYAVDASELTDGDFFTIDGRRFEFDLGSHLTVPSGGSLEGRTFTVFGNTFRYTAAPTNSTDILALPTEDARTIAQRTNTFINNFLTGTTLNVPNANSLEGESFTILGTTFTYTATPLANTDILAVIGDSANTMAARTVTVVNNVLGAGTALLNGTQVDFPAVTSITFGGSVNVPGGATLEGESLTFNGQTFTFTATPLLPSDIPITPFDTASTVASNAATVINNVLGSGSAFVNAAAPTRVSIPNIPNAAAGVRTGGTLYTTDVLTSTTLEGESITVLGVTFTYTATPSQPNDILAQVGDSADVIATRTSTAINAALGALTSFVDPGAPARVSVPVIANFASAYVRGGTMITPAGNNIDGYEFQLNGTTFRYSTNPQAAGEILARAGDAAALIASRTAVVINNLLGTNPSGAPWAVANLDRVSVSDLSVPTNGFFLGGTLDFVDATATNYEGESFTAYGTTFTFRDPAGGLFTATTHINAVAGDTAAVLAARAATAINTAVGRTVATVVGNSVSIAGAVSNTFGGTMQVVSSAAAQLDNDSINVNGFNFTFVPGAPVGNFQVQTDPSAVVVADRLVIAINNWFGAGTAVRSGATVSIKTDTTLIYNDSGAGVGITVIDDFTGTAMTFTRVADPVGTPFFADLTSSPLTVDGRSTPMSYDIPGTTLSVSAGSFVSSYVFNNRLTFPSASSISTPFGSPLIVSGGRGVTAGSKSVPVFPTMTANQVATAIRQSIADIFAATDIKIIKGSENRVQIIGHTVGNPGPLKLVTSLPGDSFGAFNAGFVNGQATRPGSLRGMNNTVEGVYIDDIIIGFAERGEMITNAPVTTGFIPNNDLYNPARPTGSDYLGIASGAYDVEIRRASDYGLSQTPSPTNILYRAIDTNARETQSIAITVPMADQIPHNSTFVLSDGWRSVTFQFIDQYIGLGALLQGNIPVIFNSQTAISGTYDDNREAVARAIVNAINSQAVQDVLAIQAMYSDTTGTTSKTIHLTGNAIFTPSAALGGVITTQVFNTFGDLNRFRDQGQIIVQSSTIRDSQNFGVDVAAAVRGGLNPTPHVGSVKNTQEENIDRLVTGVVIMNNVITTNASGGIRFRGDSANNPFGAVPYGRIVNNTLVGRNGSGIGIDVSQSASPTLLNNIVADFSTGIRVDASSAALGTTIGATLYRGNGTPFNTAGLGAGTFPIFLTPADPLFVDQANNNFYLAPFSQAIDSSLNSLGDRTLVTRVKSPLGLGVSPILAPGLDVYGQLRGDDDQVATPAGQGANVFVDRGAIDRVDFFRPTAVVFVPEDQSAIDLDPVVNRVWLNDPQNLLQLKVRLIDEGIGIDDANVVSSQFVLQMDGVTLVEGVDYVFTYNSVTNEAIFSAVKFFESERRYTILVDNDDDIVDADGILGIRDLAGNYLAPNEANGTTRFEIVVTNGVNDPPINTVPGPQVTNEDTTLVFRPSSGNAISVSDADVRLGDNRLLVTLSATNGVLTLGSLNGLTFTVGDGINDVTMTFEGDVAFLNAALNGLRFIPTPDYFGSASVTITTDDQGKFAAPGSSAMQDTDVISITVVSVNDPPVMNPLPLLTPIGEDAGPQTITSFVTGQSAGPANEPQTLTAEVTVISTTGSWNTSSFFASGGAPAIDPVTGTLTYETALDVNGTATVQVVLRDSDGAGSVPQTFVISVNPINDAPVFTLSAAASSIASNEDAGLQTVVIISTSGAARATAIDETNGQVTPPVPAQVTTWILGTVTVISGNLEFDLLEVLPNGTLRYQAKADTAGVATFDLSLQDNGLGISPHVNLSAAQSVQITVNQVNDRPVAVTPDYVVDEGYSLTLDGSGSYDVDAFFGDTLSYAWDLNNDGTYDIVTTSPITTVTWNDLQLLGVTAPDVSTISLQVTDTFGPLSSTTTATLTTLIVDYGDAPNSYGTTQAVGGAAHTINGTLFLGATVDKEFTGQPTSDATGDGADEDGVEFTTTLESDSTLSLPTYVWVTASQAGKLDVWIDLNQDGVFDPAEKLNGGSSYDVVAGANRIAFDIPAGTPIGDTFMRFRLSSAGNLSPTGRADDGEVEDYAVKVQALQAPVTPTITRPIDVVPGDGIPPETSDLTPRIDWTFHTANFFHDIVVRNAAGAVVYSQTDVVENYAQITSALSAGTYTVALTARNKAGTAAPAAEYSFTVVPLAVSSPVNDIQTYRPTIIWNAVAGTKSYSVQIVSQSTGTVVHAATINTPIGSPPAVPNSYAVPVDLPIGRYRVRVQAIDAADLPGDWSPYSNFYVRTAVNITAPESSVTTLRPQVAWNAVPGANSYLVELTSVTDSNLPVQRVTVTTNTWTPTSDLRLGEYDVTVQAFNSAGESTVVGAKRRFAVQPVPTAITPLGRLADSTPSFGWNAMIGADRYELVVRQKWGNFDVVINQSNLTTTSFTQPTDIGLGRYTYQIRAINNPSDPLTANPVYSSYSPVYEFVNTAAPTITAPQATTFSNHPVISWVNPPNAEKSDIWVAQIGGEWEFLRVNGISGTTYTPNQKVFGIGTYRVWVRTYSNTDNPATPADEREVSNWSLATTFRVSTPPTLLGPTNRTSTARPTLTWQGVPGAQTYEVWVTNNTVPVGKIYNPQSVNALNYTIPADLPIGRYTFWVRARNSFGDLSNWSAPKDFEVVAGPVLSGPPASTFITKPTFSWTNLRTQLAGFPAGANSYEFRLDGIDPVTHQYTELPQYTVAGLTGTTYTIPTDLPSGFYRAYVRAKANGRPTANVADTISDYSFPVEFFVGGRPVVNTIAPTTNTTPTITWQAVQGASGYEVFIALASNPGSAVVRRDNIGATSFAVPSPLAKGEYRVWVRAISAANNSYSVWSNSITLQIVDAVERAEPSDGIGEILYVVMPAGLTGEALSDSAVSMVPAIVADPNAVLLQTEVEDSAATVVPVQPMAGVVANAGAELIESAEVGDQADAVMAGWDKELWWDQPVVKTQEADKTSGTAGILGALMAMAPRSLRRRRRDE